MGVDAEAMRAILREMVGRLESPIRR
jgi:hypothetical protein